MQDSAIKVPGAPTSEDDCLVRGDLDLCVTQPTCAFLCVTCLLSSLRVHSRNLTQRTSHSGPHTADYPPSRLCLGNEASQVRCDEYMTKHVAGTLDHCTTSARVGGQRGPSLSDGKAIGMIYATILAELCDSVAK
jgi:hypothetical protein